MIHKFKTDDAPDANGRIPIKGEQQWVFSFPLDNGDDYLEITVGPRCRAAFERMFAQERADDVADGIGGTGD